MAGGAAAPFGIATMSARGEHLEHPEPTLVGMYVKPEFRGRQGVSLPLLVAAVARARRRGFDHVRIDVLSENMVAPIEKLPPEDREFCHVFRNTSAGFMLQ